MSKSVKKGFCHLKTNKDTLTVGDVFEMHCRWPGGVSLAPPLRVEFYLAEQSNTQPHSSTTGKGLRPKGSGKGDSSKEDSTTPPHPYSLVVLKTVELSEGKGVFLATSYKPGNYNTSFSLVSDKGVVDIYPISWQVTSVLPKGLEAQEVKPYPPYGPWLEPLPAWYWPVMVICFLALIFFVTTKTFGFFKRKKKIQEVKNRLKGKKPFLECISQLNSLRRDLETKPVQEILHATDQAFRMFLENKFFIYALKKEPKKIVKQIKNYYPLVYQKNKTPILDFFAEIKKLNTEQTKTQDLEQIIDWARELVLPPSKSPPT